MSFENISAEEPLDSPTASWSVDEVLLASVDRARQALTEITPAETIGDFVGSTVEGEHVLSLLFASKLAGYPDWRWTVTLSRISEDDEPAVLEVELMPGEGSVLAPEWVPWADRVVPEVIDDGDLEELADDPEEDETEAETEDDDLDDWPIPRDHDGIDIDAIADDELDDDELFSSNDTDDENDQV